MLRGSPDLFRKSTDASEVALELSDMFSTSTSNPICHINVFTAYLKTCNSIAVPASELGMRKSCLIAVPERLHLAGPVPMLQADKEVYK